MILLDYCGRGVWHVTLPLTGCFAATAPQRTALRCTALHCMGRTKRDEKSRRSNKQSDVRIKAALQFFFLVSKGERRRRFHLQNAGSSSNPHLCLQLTGQARNMRTVDRTPISARFGLQVGGSVLSSGTQCSTMFFCLSFFVRRKSTEELV